MTCRLLVGDCRDVLATFAPNSIDACVTDPPYGLHFMGKTWDQFGGAIGIDHKKTTQRRGSMHAGKYDLSRNAEFQLWCETWAREVYRVLKPGAHLLAFGGTRTHHRLMCALEDAGFEIRDCLMFLYGSGFPKSLDVSKALDKAAGAEREILGRAIYGDGHIQNSVESMGYQGNEPGADMRVITAPATELGRQWDGWGTALKPAYEPIILARKPLIGSVAANVTAYGTGGLNIDGCRIEGVTNGRKGGDLSNRPTAFEGGDRIRSDYENHTLGRWPANVLLDQDAAALLDAMSGELQARGNVTPTKRNGGSWFGAEGEQNGGIYPGDVGGASRFFFVSREGDDVRFRYTAKAGRAERNKGLEGMAEQNGGFLEGNADNENNRKIGARPDVPVRTTQNHHPTVKPVDLMQWLVRLITPPGGTVLDPFAGSGTTGIAADREGFNSILIEQDADYAEIARRRIIGDAPLFAEVTTT